MTTDFDQNIVNGQFGLPLAEREGYFFGLALREETFADCENNVINSGIQSAV